jgi:glutathione S-transferase
VRHIARSHGLYGSTPVEAALIDQASFGLGDLHSKVAGFMFEKDAEVKAAKVAEFKSETVPKFLGGIEKQIAASGAGWVVGSKPSFVDFELMVIVEAMNALAPGTLDAFPGVLAVAKKASERPNVAKWLKERPASAW